MLRAARLSPLEFKRKQSRPREKSQTRAGRIIRARRSLGLDKNLDMKAF